MVVAFRGLHQVVSSTARLRVFFCISLLRGFGWKHQIVASVFLGADQRCQEKHMSFAWVIMNMKVLTRKALKG